MVAATASASSQFLFSSSHSFSRLSLVSNSSSSSNVVNRKYVAAAAGIRCMAVGTEASSSITKRKSVYEIETLTNWLLKQEQTGVIDAELTIVLSIIAMACKQIASLVQRASISNLTGIQGAVNVQGEDQKKLDVVSNERKRMYQRQ